DLFLRVDLVKIHMDDVGSDGMPLDLADQRLGRLAVHRELDDGAGGLDASERLLERLGVHLERQGVASVSVDHRGDAAPEARLARGAFAGRAARARCERNNLSHTLSVVRDPWSALNRTVSSPIDSSAHNRLPWRSVPRSTAPSASRTPGPQGCGSYSSPPPHRPARHRSEE